MRTKLIAGNWKMNLTSAQGEALVKQFIDKVQTRYDTDVVVCPPYLALPKISDVTKRSAVRLGAQDVFWADEGAFTGNVSAKQLFEFCVAYCIVGHSETRGRFGKLEVPESTLPFFAETDETVNLKIKTLLFHGITPIVCVGETLAEREAGMTDAVISAQLDGAFNGIDSAEMYTMVVAYEPVWAIGTGMVCDTAEAQRVCAMVRGWVSSHFDADVADTVRILYGGSVKPDNSAELFSQPDIDGGLVGGASLDPASFAAIFMSA